ncbi:MAG: hypothetical protein EBT63_01880 [Proteobacteria bacterium]|nr:hypothetical protein [Pseudomonadota bacterium]
MKLDRIRIYWPYAIFGLFAVVIVVNIIYIILAKDSWRGIYTPDAYKKGVEYNKILENIDEQYKIGIKISNTISQRTSKDLFIETYATNKNGETLRNISIIYVFKYLPDAKYDITRLIDSTSYGNLNISLPKPGKWQLETIVKHENKIVQDLAIIEIKDEQNLEQPINP